MKYNIGDKVRIKSIDWYNENKTPHGDIWFDNAVFVGGQSLYCGCELTIRLATDDSYYVIENDYYWTDEMIDCLVERNGKIYPYKIGDRVVLKGNNRCATITDLKYNSWGNLSYYIKIDNDKDISIDYPTDLLLPYDNKVEGLVKEETKPKFKVESKFKVGDKVILDSYPCEITHVQWKDGYGFVYAVRGTDFGYTVKETDLIFDERTVPNTNETIQLIKNDWNNFKDRYDIPDDYHFVDKNGNEINISEIVLEKRYPKTDDIIKWLRECDMTKYIGVIYSGMCSITFDTEKLIKDITEMIGDE